jgi:iron(II)-dependent oxidoreductase
MSAAERASPETLAGWLRDARQRTLALVADLPDSQLRAGRGLAIVNPLLWELGHVGWFQEKWLLRRDGSPPLRPDADALYDSTAIPHFLRWDLPLPARAPTLEYLERVLEAATKKLRHPCPDDLYFAWLAAAHEDMHAEAFLYTRQTLGLPRGSWGVGRGAWSENAKPQAAERSDAVVPGGTFRLGAEPGEAFVHDNEKWAHAVEVAPFAIARTAVTQGEYQGFVEESGYAWQEFWDAEGWHWREQAGARHPVYWRPAGRGVWLRRDFDQWVPVEPDRPVLHVNWYEANAYCRWARRRLPTEAEWEMAASWVPDPDAAGQKRRFPWGDEEPSPQRANLDSRVGDCVDVGSLSAGDSACGCRQMIGNVWEWTANTFGPYPGFAADPYREYSEPWFGTHKVLRGGCWATRARLIRNTWRNFHRPHRRDVWAGFRTCAVSP